MCVCKEKKRYKKQNVKRRKQEKKTTRQPQLGHLSSQKPEEAHNVQGGKKKGTATTITSNYQKCVDRRAHVDKAITCSGVSRRANHQKHTHICVQVADKKAHLNTCVSTHEPPMTGPLSQSMLGISFSFGGRLNKGKKKKSQKYSYKFVYKCQFCLFQIRVTC